MEGFAMYLQFTTDRIALFSKSMLNDHLPSHYERATQLLLDGSPQGRDSAETQAQATSS